MRPDGIARVIGTVQPAPIGTQGEAVDGTCAGIRAIRIVLNDAVQSTCGGIDAHHSAAPSIGPERRAIDGVWWVRICEDKYRGGG